MRRGRRMSNDELLRKIAELLESERGIAPADATVEGSVLATNDSRPASELDQLAKQLDDASIPYQVFGTFLGRQLCYYGHAGRPQPKDGSFMGPGIGAVVSVIDYGYGEEQGLLEAMGLDWDPTGHLRADEIFDAISQHWEGEGA